MVFRSAILVEGDLDAADARRSLEPLHHFGRRMAIGPTVGPEQHHAIALAAVVVAKLPDLSLVESDHGLDPSLAVQVGPLIGEPQMRLDDLAAYGLKIEHSAVAGEMAPQPPLAVGFHFRLRGGANGPAVECAVARRHAGDVAPPARFAADHGDIGGDVAARSSVIQKCPGR